MRISDTTFFVVDQGILGVSIGQALAKDAKKVYYFKHWMSAFPKPHELWIGKGIPGIDRADSYEDTKKEVLAIDGIFVFPDVGDGDKQKELRELGARVFGSGESGEMEMNRRLFKRILKQQGLSAPKYGFVTGLDDLEELLRMEKDLWIKLNVENRGILETCHHEDWETSKVKWFYKLAKDLDCFGGVTNFLWEKPWPGVEAGTDKFVVNGKNFAECLYGFELKGDGYVCKRMEMDQLPPPIKLLESRMTSVERMYDTCGAVSSEVRVGENKVPYYVDPCRRFGNPPTACITAMYKNFAEVVAGIADGIEIKPEWNSEYGAELSIDVLGADESSVKMDLKDKDFDSIKLRAACKIENAYYNIPFKSVGTVAVKAVGLGSSKEEAEFNVLKSAKEFCDKTKYAYYDPETFDKLDEELEKADKFEVGL
jgi:hypothetical protein